MDGALFWETRDAWSSLLNDIYFASCPDDSKSFGDCNLQEGVCSKMDKQVFLHCRGKLSFIFMLNRTNYGGHVLQTIVSLEHTPLATGIEKRP